MSGADNKTVSACYICGKDARRGGEKNGHALFRCSLCGFLFVSPLPPSVADIYGKDYFVGAKKGFGYVDYDTDKGPMIPTFKKYLQLIREVLDGEGALLDVGAATGFFVSLAREAGFDASGVELSGHAASRARERGLDVRRGTLADISGTYDVITMLDLIEHVPYPRADVRKAALLLRPGGILAINTPDAGSLLARLMGLKWHLIVPPEHLYYFNRKNIGLLLEQEKFDVVLDTTIGKSFTLPYVLITLHKWTKVSLFARLASMIARMPLSRISIPLNLRDNMFILARKRA